MTFKQVKDLLDIGFIPSIIVVPSSNNSNNGSGSDEKIVQDNSLNDSTNSYITQIIGYETYNEEEITTYIVRLANDKELYARNQMDELSSSLPESDGGGVVTK